MLISHLRRKNFVNSRNCNDFFRRYQGNIQTYLPRLFALEEVFTTRFVDFRNHESLLKIYSYPFDPSVDVASLNDSLLEYEVTNLREDRKLHMSLVQHSDLIRFYASLDEGRYPHLRDIITRCSALFRREHLCMKDIQQIKKAHTTDTGERRCSA